MTLQFAMGLQYQQFLFGQDLILLLQYIVQQGYTFSIGAVFRSEIEEQADIDAGLSHLKDAGNSKHCKKLAADIYIFTESGMLVQHTTELTKFWNYWEKLGPQNRAGGYFPKYYHTSFVDGNHYEREPV